MNRLMAKPTYFAKFSLVIVKLLMLGKLLDDKDD